MNTKDFFFRSRRCKISRLNKYLLKQALIPFIAGFSLFSFILLMDRAFQLFDFLIGKDVPFVSVIGIFVYSLPFIMALTVPMGVLVSTIATYGRMSSDFEILAMRSLGINPISLTRGFFLMAFGITIGMTFFNIYVLPESNFRLKQLYSEVSRARPTLHLLPGKFNEISKYYTLWAKTIDHSTSELTEIILKDESPAEPARIIYAAEGKMKVLGDSIMFSLNSGETHIYDRAKPTEYRIINFNNYIVSVPLKEKTARNVSRSYREMNLKQLLENARRVNVKRRKWRYLLEAQKKFSIPFACLVFVLIGAPLGIQTKKGGLGNGITLSFFLFMLYYIILVGGEELCERGSLYPSLAMWLPNIIIGITGIYLFYKIIYEK
ncbi:MAG: LptF/LptG family permease [candidate division WOR-3 bacterium]|jgi:lipopolysaccharide export system permease protein